MAERRPRCVPIRMRDTRTCTANTAVSICQYILLTNIYIYEDDFQLCKLNEKCFATQALSRTPKNVSEPQTGFEPATF